MDERTLQAIYARVQRIPIVDTLQLTIDEFGPGFCKGTVPRKRCYDGVYESFHGGLLMTVADSLACFAIFTQTGPDEHMTTTDMNIRFLAPCLTDVTAVARVIKLGRTLCPVAVELFDAAGTLVAVAQVTYMRLPRAPRHANGA
ncbi:MAG: PaaI family thioesterase [Planctomycetes bacterium]|nr:PaaI family thioesterase [Planctomycetota bacterium]